MLNDDFVAKRGSKRAAAGQLVGAREAAQILGVARSTVFILTKSGRLPGTFRSNSSLKIGYRNRWVFRKADVLALKREGRERVRRRPQEKASRQTWRRLFGPIPPGYTVRERDGNPLNTEPSNLYLAPLKVTLQRAKRRRTRRHGITRWTREQIALLRRDYTKKRSREIADALGMSELSVRNKARRLRLRKSPAFIAALGRETRSAPIGTEFHEPVNDVWYVKVSLVGPRHHQWRRKHRVIWEQANGRAVPPGYRVIFKDGDRKNFDPSNLELTTRDEVSACAFAKFLSYPPAVQQVIRLTKQLNREIARQSATHCYRAGPKRHKTNGPTGRKKSRNVRWTPEHLDLLRRDYPTKRTEEIAEAIGVSPISVRVKARRLGVRKSPEAIIAHACKSQVLPTKSQSADGDQ